MVDLNRGSAASGDLLPTELSTEIFADAIENSLVMQAARRINVPGGGLTIPVITGDAEADWVAETDEKPVDNATVTTKQFQTYTLAVIEPFSNQFRRDLGALYNELARRLPAALSRKFDQTVLHGTSGDRPGSNFDTLGGTDTVAFSRDGSDAIEGLVEILSTVANEGGDTTGWVLSPQAEALLMGATDPSGNYVFLRDPSAAAAQIGSLYGRPVYKGRAAYEAGTPNRLGVAGDWNTAMWGTTGNISVSISDQSSLKLANNDVLHLWQRNMFALRAEVEIGFIVEDENKFISLVDDES